MLVARVCVCKRQPPWKIYNSDVFFLFSYTPGVARKPIIHPSTPRGYDCFPRVSYIIYVCVYIYILYIIRILQFNAIYRSDAVRSREDILQYAAAAMCIYTR